MQNRTEKYIVTDDQKKFNLYFVFFEGGIFEIH